MSLPIPDTHGSTARASASPAERDVFLEETKDSALAIYSREVAMRVYRTLDARSATSPRSRPNEALELARRYDLDYLVTEAHLPLPLAHSNTQFHIYALSTRLRRFAATARQATHHLRGCAATVGMHLAPSHPRTFALTFEHPRTS